MDTGYISNPHMYTIHKLLRNLVGKGNFKVHLQSERDVKYLFKSNQFYERVIWSGKAFYLLKTS